MALFKEAAQDKSTDIAKEARISYALCLNTKRKRQQAIFELRKLLPQGAQPTMHTVQALDFLALLLRESGAPEVDLDKVDTQRVTHLETLSQDASDPEDQAHWWLRLGAAYSDAGTKTDLGKARDTYQKVIKLGKRAGPALRPRARPSRHSRVDALGLAVVDGLRNLREVKLEAHEKLNAFLGPNGVGKTSALEAIHLAARLAAVKARRARARSHRLRQGQGPHQANFDLDGPLPVEVDLLPRGKRRHSRASTCATSPRSPGGFGVAFVPSDLELVRGGPENVGARSTVWRSILSRALCRSRATTSARSIGEIAS